MTSAQFVGLGLLLLLAGAGLHWLLWNRYLGAALQAPEAALRAEALKRWLKAVAVAEVVGLLLTAGWLLGMRRQGSGGLAWIAPAVGLLAGNAFPLQLAVLGITRSAKAPR